MSIVLDQLVILRVASCKQSQDMSGAVIFRRLCHTIATTISNMEKQDLTKTAYRPP